MRSANPSSAIVEIFMAIFFTVFVFVVFSVMNPRRRKVDSAPMAGLKVLFI